jgi:hypothetical protein
MAAFKKLFKDQFSARMEYILNNIILALLENDGQSLLGVNRMLTDKDFRKQIVSNVTDPTVKDFWEKEYANYTDRFAAEAAPAIQNKVGQFVANPLIRNIIGQQKTSFDIRKLMDEKKILIVNLSKGKVGEGNANLIGSLLITKIYLAAMSRADVGPYELEKLPPFYFYVDEFQNFANESFASILSEARKYNLALTVAHQYVEQMEDEVKSAVFGNVGTMIVFRVGATDAEIFEKEFAPYFTMDDIVNLSAYQVYLRLMIDGVGSNPFSAKMLAPIQRPPISHEQAVIAYTRTTYGKPKFVVEEEISAFYTPAHKEVAPKIEPKKPYQENASSKNTQPDQKRPMYNNPQNGGAVQKEERKLQIRKITDETPLPPRRFEPKKEEPKKESIDDSYNKSRQIEESFHQPPQVKAKQFFEEHKQRQDSPLKKMDVPNFDDRPAMSLKEALAKAMTENTRDKKQDEHEVDTKEYSDKEIMQKEVSEEILRKLLED